MDNEIIVHLVNNRDTEITACGIDISVMMPNRTNDIQFVTCKRCKQSSVHYRMRNIEKKQKAKDEIDHLYEVIDYGLRELGVDPSDWSDKDFAISIDNLKKVIRGEDSIEGWGDVSEGTLASLIFAQCGKIKALEKELKAIKEKKQHELDQSST